MKMKLTCCTLVVAGVLVVNAQPFRNLGFEEANTNSSTFFQSFRADGLGTIVYGIGPAQDLIPGWQIFKGSDLVTTIGINSRAALAGLPVNLTTPSLDAKYGLAFGFNAEDKPWSLVQRGDVPANAPYLSFKTFSGAPVIRPPQLTLNGEEISIVRGLPASFGPDRLVFDVSKFAGQNAELRFIFDVNTSYRSLDDIRFLVPEPTPVSMMVVGLLFLVTWRSTRRGPILGMRKPIGPV